MAESDLCTALHSVTVHFTASDYGAADQPRAAIKCPNIRKLRLGIASLSSTDLSLNKIYLKFQNKKVLLEEFSFNG